MVKMCMPVRENGAKFAPSSRKARTKFVQIWAKFAFARVAADTSERHNTNRALNGHYGQPVCGKGVLFSRGDLYFIFFRIFETISSRNPCILVGPQHEARGEKQNGLPQPCLLGGPKEGGIVPFANGR